MKQLILWLTLMYVSLVRCPWVMAQEAQARSSARLTVAAAQKWTPTNMTVSRGDSLWFAIFPEDLIQCSSSYRSNADGANLPTSPSMPLPGAATCALIGKIGNGDPFLIGLREARFIAEDDGLLSLGVNDYRFQDNAGEFVVVVKKSSNPEERGLSRLVVDVSSVQAWTSTRVNLQSGQNMYFLVSPDDEINCDRQPTKTNAAGVQDHVPKTSLIIPGVPECALLGRVGSAPPFLIGLDPGPFAVPAGGALMLGINDDDHYDNSGEFKVFLVVD